MGCEFISITIKISDSSGKRPNFFTIFFAALVAIIFLWPPFLYAQECEVIESVKIVGNKRIDESTILYYIQSKPGTVLSKLQIRKDIEQIYSLGQFKDIQVDTQNRLEGLELQFLVEEIPSIGDVEILGSSNL